jgi:hypothetical protein
MPESLQEEHHSFMIHQSPSARCHKGIELEYFFDLFETTGYMLFVYQNAIAIEL